MNFKFTKFSICFFLGLVFANMSFAQTSFKVGNNPTAVSPSTALEVESTNKGVILPRYSTAGLAAIATPAKGMLVIDTQIRCVKIYTGTSWDCVGAGYLGNNLSTNSLINITSGTGTGATLQNVTVGVNVTSLKDTINSLISRQQIKAVNYFYMPNISFNTSTLAVGQTKDLYSLYRAQFLAPPIRSTGAPVSVPSYAAATDLYYYITSYDATVFANVTINASGLMTYDIIGNATDCSFINVVFVIR